ncbi:MAG TPA: nucleoside deaminase [Pseudonocardiaceae bacterium]|jgi:tRNA(adenine34) deaminase|nr:nucleoside deaminase [Pseudonocardiaceae bacterium]
MTAPAGADAALVRRAIEVAGGAATTGDIPIGAVLLDADGVELAAACNAREATGDPTAHAEILVLRAGAARLRRDGRGDGWRLAGCTLAVTVEPCTMCAGALVAARVRRLVFGAWEPKTGAVGSLWDVVRDRRLNHRPEVHGGVLAEECAALLTGFMRLRRL